MVATFGVSDGASDRSDRRHATARRALRHRRRGRGDRRRAPRARSRTRPRSVHAQHARAPAPRRGTGRHALRPDPGARSCCGRGCAPTRRASIAGCARRRSCTRRTTSRRRAGCPTLVSVYDCSFVRYPELCTPEVRAFDPVDPPRRRAGRDTAHRVGVRGRRDRGDLRPGPARRGPARRDPARRPVARRRGARCRAAVAAAVGGAPFVVAIGTLEPRKNFAHLVGAFGELAARHPDLRLVIAGHDGPARPEIDAAIARLPGRARASASCSRATVSDAGRRALLERATLLAYPSIYEGFGFPVLEAMTAGVPVVAARARVDPRGRGRRRAARRADQRAGLADEMDRVLTDDATRAELIARGRDRVHAFSWDHTARALASCYRRLAEQGRREGRGARRSAAAAGAGRHRPLRDRAAAPPPRPRRRADRVRGRDRPRSVAPRVPWIDLGAPHGSVRYELWSNTGSVRLSVLLWERVVDLLRIVGAVATGTAVLFVIGLVSYGQADLFPRTVPFSLKASSRSSGWRGCGCWPASPRNVDGGFTPKAGFQRGPRRVLFVGAGDAGTRIGWEDRRHPDHGEELVGYLDDNPAKRRLKIAGSSVLGGVEDLPRVAKERLVDEVLITMPAAGGKATHRVVEVARDAGVGYRVLPGVTQVLLGEARSSRGIRAVKVEDLLRRKPVPLELPASYLQGGTALVTGAGGSVGSELVRQSTGRHGKVILYGHGENTLHDIGRELRRPSRARFHDRHRRHPRSHQGHEHDGAVPAFRRLPRGRYKHVPLMEAHPDEAILNNVAGTRNVAEAALANGVARLVNVSTDKAVHPASMLGVTKFLAERVVRMVGAAAGEDQVFASVRFGNVLGSRGSVVPNSSNSEYAVGGPLTLTDPRMTRYFMTNPGGQPAGRRGRRAQHQRGRVRAGYGHAGDDRRPGEGDSPARGCRRGRHPDRLHGLASGEELTKSSPTRRSFPRPPSSTSTWPRTNARTRTVARSFELLISAAERRDWSNRQLPSQPGARLPPGGTRGADAASAGQRDRRLTNQPLEHARGTAGWRTSPRSEPRAARRCRAARRRRRCACRRPTTPARRSARGRRDCAGSAATPGRRSRGPRPGRSVGVVAAVQRRVLDVRIVERVAQPLR